MEKLWYVVNTYSGHEDKVKEKLMARAESMGFQDYIFRVIVPKELDLVKQPDGTMAPKMVKQKDGTMKPKEKNMFPGYVLVEMIMTDEAWYIVRNTPGVTGFIGSSGKGAKPTPLMPQEIDKILANMGMSRIDTDKELEVGVKVDIIDGPFKGLSGKVDSIDKEKAIINVLVDLFGQETPVELQMFQVSIQD